MGFLPTFWLPVEPQTGGYSGFLYSLREATVMPLDPGVASDIRPAYHAWIQN
jgi:hypothetical protein